MEVDALDVFGDAKERRKAKGSPTLKRLLALPKRLRFNRFNRFSETVAINYVDLENGPAVDN